MSRMEELFKNHNIHQALSDYIGLLANYETDSNETEALDFFYRFKQCGRYIQELLERAIVELASPPLLNDWANNIANATNEIRAYISNKNIGHLHNANSSLDNLLRLLTDLPVVGDSDSATGINKLISDVTNESQKYITKLKTQVDAQETRLLSIEQISNKQSNDIQEISTKITEQKNHLDSIAANFQSQFSQAQEERSKAFHEAIQKQTEGFTLTKSEFDTTFKKFIADAEKQKNEQIDKFNKEASSVLDELLNTKKEAAKLLKITSDIVITGNYKNFADKEKGTANLLRWIAISCMVGVAVIAVVPSLFHISDFAEPKDFWLNILYRLPVSLVLLVPAFYTARESTKHRQNEFFNRQLELKLASIDPYLASIGDTKKEEIKIELTQHFFGQSSSNKSEKGDDDKDVIVVTKDVLGVVKELISVFKK